METFEKLVELLSSVGREWAFPAPASDEQLEALERKIGHALPAGLRRIYKIHNCEPVVMETDENVGPILFYDYAFLSVERAIEKIDLWQGTRDYFAARPRYLPPCTCQPPETVKSVDSSPHWLPFAGDGANSHLAIDFDPGPAGVEGQVINFGRDETVHFQLATSFEDFLAGVLASYEKGKGHRLLGDESALYDRLTGLA